MPTIFLIRHKLITGVRENPQTVTFGSLEDAMRLVLPSEFADVPDVGIVLAYQDRTAFIVPDSVTVFQFQIALSDYGDVHRSTPCYFDFLIRGTAV